jgi:hypothetical protein
MSSSTCSAAPTCYSTAVHGVGLLTRKPEVADDEPGLTPVDLRLPPARDIRPHHPLHRLPRPAHSPQVRDFHHS